MNAILPPTGVAAGADVIDTLAAAFLDDFAAHVVYPDDADYLRHFPGFIVALCGRAFDEAVVDFDPDGLGAAVWLPPGVWPDEHAIGAHLEATIPPDRLALLAAGMEQQAALHPAAPHWYLPWIGVRPEAQGQGIGSALLRKGLGRADADGMPAYLEATNRRNAALYSRYGFVEIGVVKAPGYPEIIGMWRPGKSEPYSG